MLKGLNCRKIVINDKVFSVGIYFEFFSIIPKANAKIFNFFIIEMTFAVFFLLKSVLKAISNLQTCLKIWVAPNISAAFNELI